jgi:hypothetical protein
MLEVPQKVQDLQALDREFEELRGDVGAPYLSQWTFERSLDRLASALSTYLSSQIDGKVGCSLLYLGEALDYHVGGSSTDRRTMQQSARHYDLRNSEQARSFTGYSLNHYTTFLLNDFPKACAKFSQVITHKAKSCEMPEHYTLSYVCIPAPIEGETARMVGDSDELVAEDPEKKNILALGAIRISSSSREIAKAIPNLLPNHMQRTVFSLIEEGRRKALLNRGNSALAIADLQTDLLQYRNKEFQGLDQLAFHIQTLFGDCQCSIFIAHEKQKTISAGRREVALYLAATTALSPSEQHVRFRRKFFDQNEHYSCYFDQSFRPLPGELESCTKTALAYYRPEEPVCENQNTGSKRFAGHGELRTAGFFLALAIPAPKPQDRPYGVIRIVRESRETFSEEERRLAAAIARALTYWLDFFPKAEDLEIDWVSESQRVRILKTLFGIISFVKTDPSRVDLLGKAEVELNWLLEKIFCNCKKISITQIFGGKSGAVALLVKNDSGRDLILKCSYRPPGEAQAENDITREVRNYSQFIEGKLQLNHNVIYPELIRETRNLVVLQLPF